MSSKIQDVRDDLAFMRALADGGPAPQWTTFGRTYLAAGLIYGAQCLFHWGQSKGWVTLAPLPALLVSLGFTAVFLAVLAWILWLGRARPMVGISSRAISSTFAAVGAANLVMVALFGVVAMRHHSLTIWLIYPAMVFALQGAAWMVAAQLRRQGWMTVIALGWFGSSLALGLSIDSPVYVAVCGVSLLLWMALPGALMLRGGRTAG